jgi:hypothetical protein
MTILPGFASHGHNKLVPYLSRTKSDKYPEGSPSVRIRCSGGGQEYSVPVPNMGEAELAPLVEKFGQLVAEQGAVSRGLWHPVKMRRFLS